VLDKYINSCLGVEKVSRNDLILPGLLFRHDSSFPAASYFSKINGKEPAIKLRYFEIDLKENFYTPVGVHKYFNGELKVTADNEIAERQNVINHNVGLPAQIKYKKTSLSFEHGKARIFYKGRELTKGLGLYTSAMSAGLWYDSSQASWGIKELEKGKLTAIGHWPRIPMTQRWDFFLPDEKTIIWKIEREIWDDAVLDKEQVNLMLSDAYKEWFTNKRIAGKFPGRFNDHNGFCWDRLWCADAPASAGVKKCKLKKGIFSRGILPSLIFGFSPHCQGRYCVIENTDDLFQSRLLQCELGAGEEKKAYFDGYIRIANPGF
jgi:hypothetical protein